MPISIPKYASIEMFDLVHLNIRNKFPQFMAPSKDEYPSYHQPSKFKRSIEQSISIWTINKGVNLIIKRRSHSSSFPSSSSSSFPNDDSSNNSNNFNNNHKDKNDNDRFKIVNKNGDQVRAPDFSNVRRPTLNGSTNRPLTYFVVGATGVLSAISAKSTVMNFLTSLSASGDVMAMAKVEVDLSVIPEGKSVVIKWRGKPVFIRHRTVDEIETANSVDLSQLRDPQKDSDRVQRAEWIVMLGICTHLGCVPLSDSGDYGGWYCPCQ